MPNGMPRFRPAPPTTATARPARPSWWLDPLAAGDGEGATWRWFDGGVWTPFVARRHGEEWATTAECSDPRLLRLLNISNRPCWWPDPLAGGDGDTSWRWFDGRSWTPFVATRSGDDWAVAEEDRGPLRTLRRIAAPIRLWFAALVLLNWTVTPFLVTSALGEADQKIGSPTCGEWQGNENWVAALLLYWLLLAGAIVYGFALSRDATVRVRPWRLPAILRGLTLGAIASPAVWLVLIVSGTAANCAL